MHINVSGDTNVGVVDVGINPVFLAKLGSNLALAINGDQTVTIYLALFPQSAAINTITQPAGSVAGASAASSSNGNIYIANNGSGDVTVIPGSANTAIGNVKVGLQPVSVATNSASSKVYVVTAASVPPGVTVINSLDNTLGKSISTGTNPIWATVSDDGKQVFVVDQGGNQVFIIDTLTDTVVATVSLGAGSSPNFAFYDGKLKRLYVTNTGAARLSVIRTDINPPVLADVALTAPAVSVTVLADGSRAYAALGGCPVGTNHVNLPANLPSCNGNLVSSIDALALKELRTILVGPGAVSVASSSDSSKVYVVGAHDLTTIADTVNKPPTPSRTVSTPSVSVIRTSTDTVLRRSTDPSITTLVPSFLAPAQDPNCQPTVDIHFNLTVPIPCTGQTAFMVRTFP